MSEARERDTGSFRVRRW